MSDSLRIIAIVSLLFAVAIAITIAIDLARRPQTMWIMNVVWPVTALWAGPLVLYPYARWGRAGSKHAVKRANERGTDPPNRKQPFPVLAGKAATHCGSGCALGDIVAEWLIVLVPITVFGRHIFGAWIYDFVFAYCIGIVFQYFTIKPMRNLSFRNGLIAAVKADTMSLVAWQLGMYGWMAIVTFALFRHELPKSSPVFWFMMQIAMICGFLTSYPVNWWLLRRGVKERM